MDLMNQVECCDSPKSLVSNDPPSPLVDLQSNRKHLEARLKKVTDAIEYLEKNPEFNNAFDILQKGLRA